MNKKMESTLGMRVAKIDSVVKQLEICIPSIVDESKRHQMTVLIARLQTLKGQLTTQATIRERQNLHEMNKR